MPKLVVMLRVKDGVFFVHEWLKCFEKIADEIVVLDNGSTDGTFEILNAHPKVAAIQRTFDYHEGRDKILMYELARSRQPDWCLWLDVDEIFEPELTRAHFDRLMSNKTVNKYGFRRFHFIDREYFAASWYRLNYISGHDRVLWREAPGGYFQDLIIDSPNVKGIKGITWNTSYRLKHLGYINKEIVDKKATLYRSIIPEKEATFQRMYLSGEKRLRWIDNRNHPKVLFLNMFLNVIQVKNLFPKALRKAINRIRKADPAGATLKAA
ncbi:MAG: glycosyltransferase family 2 protein [Chitinophagaceae bacterium]|nr:glycosyltransferase family 2 protein [Chitinophagaceae bacterium]